MVGRAIAVNSIGVGAFIKTKITGYCRRNAAVPDLEETLLRRTIVPKRRIAEAFVAFEVVGAKIALQDLHRGAELLGQIPLALEIAECAQRRNERLRQNGHDENNQGHRHHQLYERERLSAFHDRCSPIVVRSLGSGSVSL